MFLTELGARKHAHKLALAQERVLALEYVALSPNDISLLEDTLWAILCRKNTTSEEKVLYITPLLLIHCRLPGAQKLGAQMTANIVETIAMEMTLSNFIEVGNILHRDGLSKLYEFFAVRPDSLVLLNYAHTVLDVPLTEELCYTAADIGNLEILKWAHERNCPWGDDICKHVAMGGHLEMLQYIRGEGCSWDAGTCEYAALCGHSHIIKWAIANGCLWDTNTCTNAAMMGYLEVLKWAHEMGCPWASTTSLRI